MMSNYTSRNSILALALVLAGTASAQKVMEPSSVLSINPIAAPSASSGRGMPPSNDLCGSVSPVNLAVGASITFNGTTVDATSTGDYVPGSLLHDVDAPSVWHAFTTTACANVTIAYCNTMLPFDNVWLIVTPSCPAGDDFVIATTYDFTSCASDNITMTFSALPAGTWYLPVLSDVDDAYGPYEIQVSAVACGTSYCAAGANFTQYEKISNVTVAGINNTTSSTAGYEDHTSITGTMARGSSYAISVSISDGYPTDEVRVWIDLDQNFTFSANELLYTSAQGVGPHNGLITIPMTATLGATRMRIRLHDADPGENPNNTPCGNSDWGQVEDYTIMITDGGSTPPNDNCDGATVQTLPVGGSIAIDGNNTGATLDPIVEEVIVWEAFSITECSHVTIDYCLPGSVFADFYAQMATNCPDFLVGLVGGTYDACTVTFEYLEAGTYYIPLLVTSDTPQGAYTIGVSSVPCPQSDYCNASATNTSVNFEKIAEVTFNGLTNSSTSAAGYEDFTSVVFEATAGQSYTLSVTASNPFDEDQLFVWIDLDQNNEFDVNELVFLSTIGSGPYTTTITIPVGSALGTTRMRLRLQDTHDGTDYPNVFNPTPCGTHTYGQVEDYSISIDMSTGTMDHDQISWSVFPNPTEGELTIRSTGLTGPVITELFDMTGRVVFQEQRTFADGELQLLHVGGNVSAGTYILRLSTNSQRYELPVMVR